jgi:hypothetical protein
MGVGCGGPEFELANSDASTTPSDATTQADSPVPDGNVPPISDASASDGSASGSDGSGPPLKDGASAADASDAAAADGSPADAAEGDGSPAAFRCANLTATDVVFCSDFDEQNAPPWNWPIELENGKGVLAADTTDFLSSPNGFAASNPDLISGSATLTSLATTFVSSAAHIDYVFEMFVKTYGGVGSTGNPSVPVAQLQVGEGGSTALFLNLVLEGSQLHLEQSYALSEGGQQTQSSAVMGTIGSKEWVKVEMLLDRSVMPWTVTVLLAGTAGLNAPAAIALTAPNDTNLEVSLGIIEIVPPIAANAFTFDNVVVRAY